jgi:hypothetical protein
VECAICLERVLGARGRKFGLLDACDHAFCLPCIRSWRATAERGPAGDAVRDRRPRGLQHRLHARIRRRANRLSARLPAALCSAPTA